MNSSTVKKKKRAVTKLKGAAKLLIASKKKKIVKKKATKKKKKKETPEKVQSTPEIDDEDKPSSVDDDDLDGYIDLAENSLGHSILQIPENDGTDQTEGAGSARNASPAANAPTTSDAAASTQLPSKKRVTQRKTAINKPKHPDGDRNKLETQRSMLREGYTEGPFFHKSQGRSREELINRRNGLRNEWEQSHSDLTVDSLRAHSGLQHTQTQSMLSQPQGAAHAFTFSQQPSPIVQLSFASPERSGVDTTHRTTREEFQTHGDTRQSEIVPQTDALELMEREVGVRDFQGGSSHAPVIQQTSGGTCSTPQVQQSKQPPVHPPRSLPQTHHQSHLQSHYIDSTVAAADANSIGTGVRNPVSRSSTAYGSTMVGAAAGAGGGGGVNGVGLYNSGLGVALEQHQRQLERIQSDRFNHEATKERLRTEQRMRSAEGAAVELQRVQSKHGELEAELTEMQARHEQLVAWCEQQDCVRKDREAECEQMRQQLKELAGLVESSSSTADAAVDDLKQARHELSQAQAESMRWRETFEALEAEQDKKGEEQLRTYKQAAASQEASRREKEDGRDREDRLRAEVSRLRGELAAAGTASAGLERALQQQLRLQNERDADTDEREVRRQASERAVDKLRAQLAEVMNERGQLRTALQVEEHQRALAEEERDQRMSMLHQAKSELNSSRTKLSSFVLDSQAQTLRLSATFPNAPGGLAAGRAAGHYDGGDGDHELDAFFLRQA
jgi:hypothetical protein